MSLFIDDTILYVENSEDYTHALLNTNLANDSLALPTFLECAQSTLNQSRAKSSNLSLFYKY